MREDDVYIDDYLLQDDGLIITLDSEESLLPPVRNNSVTIPGRPGAYDFGGEFDVRPFNLICVKFSDSHTNFKFDTRKFSGRFKDQYGKLKTVKLRFGDEPDKFYWVRLTSGIPIEKLAKNGRFVLPLTAYDPAAYSIVTSDEVTWGSTELTFASSYEFGHMGTGVVNVTAPQTINYTVTGDYLKPKIEITGSATSLTISANGRSISLPSFSNVTWVIDGEMYDVLKNGQNAIGEVIGPFNPIEFFNGDNELQITGTGLNFTLKVPIRDKYS
ncbi:phage tail domain-containing protein [Jeotgalibacillus proteolyticus]|uniref:Phage tail family protein n=1 Tax=Jeotgalibacillus proteolyticus TaxID=2082395 RepID=A0A2S5GAK2_9BACL|nr:phage tail domain-containing protein [Jeotgalibacillus proteolyticus]PPA70032.1 phage tail family protein [Jeotgalibacillus proteolyticus]